MANRYYVDSSNTKENQTVYIRRNEERIVFIGSQIHRPIEDPKSFIGAFLFDVNKWSKMMFVHLNNITSNTVYELRQLKRYCINRGTNE